MKKVKSLEEKQQIRQLAVDVYRKTDRYYRENRFEDVIFYCKRALSIDPDYPEPYLRLGYIGILSQHYEQSSILFRDFLKCTKLDGDIIGEGRAQMAFGALEFDQKNYTMALGFYKNALLIFERLGLRGYIANNLNNVGLVYKRLGDFRGALKYYEKALSIAKAMKDKHKLAFYYYNIANLYKEKGKFSKASKYLGKSRALNLENYNIKDEDLMQD